MEILMESIRMLCSALMRCGGLPPFLPTRTFIWGLGLPGAKEMLVLASAKAGAFAWIIPTICGTAPVRSTIMATPWIRNWDFFPGRAQGNQRLTAHGNLDRGRMAPSI